MVGYSSMALTTAHPYYCMIDGASVLSYFVQPTVIKVIVYIIRIIFFFSPSCSRERDLPLLTAFVLNQCYCCCCVYFIYTYTAVAICIISPAGGPSSSSYRGLDCLLCFAAVAAATACLCSGGWMGFATHGERVYVAWGGARGGIRVGEGGGRICRCRNINRRNPKLTYTAV